MKKQLVEEKVWITIPAELMLEIMKEMPQEHLMVLTKAKVPGFRAGKIPQTLLIPKAAKAYRDSELVKERLHGFLRENTKDLMEDLKRVPLKKLREQALELMKEMGRTKVLLAVFLDSRKGSGTIARELWENAPSQKEQLKEAAELRRGTEQGEPKLASNEPATSTPKDLQPDKGPKHKKDPLKLERSLQKKEKKRKEESQKYNKIISSKDKKIAQLKVELKNSSKRLQQLENSLSSIKERELTQKILIKKLEDEFSAINGQIKKFSSDYETLQQAKKTLEEQNLILRRENTSLKVELELTGDQARCEDADPYKDLFEPGTLRGQFSFTVGEGWLIGENQIFNIPIGLVKEHNLVSGDEIEVVFEPEKGEKIISLRVVEKTAGEEINGYLLIHNEDYWVRAGLEMIYVGEDEVLRVRAEEGDPVSLLVPRFGEKKSGYITKIHRVYDIKYPEKKQSLPKLRHLNPCKKNFAKHLTGIKLLVVGGDSLKHRFIQELEALGAEVEWQSGFGEIAAIPNKVKRAEVVLLLTSNNSHTATNLARQAVEHFRKKVLYYHSTSIRGAIQTVLQFCKQGEGDQNENNLCQ